MSTVAVPSNDVSTDAPGLTGSTRETHTVAVPSVEYGPGMDASVITGDNTGEASTSPVPEGQSYIDIIMDAASQSGVNPYVIGAMILQEQGKGTSGSISGRPQAMKGFIISLMWGPTRRIPCQPLQEVFGMQPSPEAMDVRGIPLLNP